MSSLLIRCSLALGLLCGVGTAYAATGASIDGSGASSAASSGQLIDFDIPAQPLAAALRRYAEMTHVSIGMQTSVGQGLVSSEVHGRFSFDEALRRLLAGTGLTAERDGGDDHAASYFLSRTSAPTAPTVGWATLASHPDYAGQVQSSIWLALCADPHTEPGTYRLVFSFQIDDAGRLAETRLIDSTGGAQRDAVVLAALQQVRVSPPPASLLRHRLLMTLLPVSTPTTMRCPQRRSNDD